MIYIDRNRKEANSKWIRPGKKWFDWAKEKTAIARREKKTHKADRDIYAHDEVKKALEKLFFNKCAYCEWKPTPGADWDVEHFRPKGRVAERKDHPGYYWLAYTWSNLYPSCQHCNQRRKDRSLWDDPEELPAAGKLDQFPLEDESKRAMSEKDSIRKEAPLLFDPCFDKPHQHLGYDPKGNIIAISDSPRATKTIEVFHLNRRRLRDGRRSCIQEVTDLLKIIRNENRPETVADLKKFLDKHYLHSGAQFAGVVRFVVAQGATFDI